MERTDSMFLDSRQAKRREIVRVIVRFAEKRDIAIDWKAVSRYVRTGNSTDPILIKRRIEQWQR